MVADSKKFLDLFPNFLSHLRSLFSFVLTTVEKAPLKPQMKLLFTFLVHFVTFHKLFCHQDEICMSKVCLLDAARLIEFATDDEHIRPCDDFREYSLGKLLQYRSMYDEVDKSGLSDTQAHHLRLIKILKAPIKKEETEVHKIVKNFFQKCTDEGVKKF